MISIEKLNAKPNARASQRFWSTAIAFSVITRQKALVTTVNAFFSEKYFFITDLFCGYGVVKVKF